MRGRVRAGGSGNRNTAIFIAGGGESARDVLPDASGGGGAIVWQGGARAGGARTCPVYLRRCTLLQRRRRLVRCPHDRRLRAHRPIAMLVAVYGDVILCGRQHG